MVSPTASNVTTTLFTGTTYSVMGINKKQNKGVISELVALTYLAKLPDTVDIVTLDLTTGKFQSYDVKAKNFRKKDYTGKDGYTRKRIGSFIHRSPTKEQKKLNIKIIYE